jgi:preprotein translocase subunit SecD
VVGATALRACGIAIVVVLATACGGEPARTDAAMFQLRPVVEVVRASSPGSDAPDPTCNGGSPEASACLRAHASASVVVFEPSNMDTYVLGPVVVDGADVAEARALRNAAVGWEVIVDLTPEGSHALEAATRMSVGHRIAILVDGRIVSAPTVQAPIGSGTVVVTGGRSEAEAKALAERLGGG